MVVLACSALFLFQWSAPTDDNELISCIFQETQGVFVQLKWFCGTVPATPFNERFNFGDNSPFASAIFTIFFLLESVRLHLCSVILEQVPYCISFLIASLQLE